MLIKDNVFLVTGGGSGLGAACVNRFAGQGGKIVIADLDRSAGERLSARWKGAVRFVPTDVTSEPDVRAAVDAAWNGFGALHGIVNCAGIGTPAKVLSKEGEPHPLELFSRIVGVNLIGTFNVVRLAVASIVNRNPLQTGERAVVINTASVAAFEGQIGQAAYSASKGGIVAMTLPLARELSRFGIRVMTIAPGIFETPMLAGLPEKARESLAQQVPFPPRLGNPDEYAALAQHILENEMLNGEVIRLDGAMRMGAK